MRRLLQFLLFSLILPAGALPQETSWYNVTTFSIINSEQDLLNGMRTGFGYRFNPWIAVGGGAGLERYTDQPMYGDYRANLSLMPLFAEVRYTVLNRRVSPVIALNGGYKVLLNLPSSNMIDYTYTIYPGIAWNRYYEYDAYTRGGLFLTAEAGVRGLVYKRWGVYLAVEYSLWSVAGTHHTWEYQYLAKPEGTEAKEYHYTSTAVAYTHVFGLRIGFTY